MKKISLIMIICILTCIFSACTDNTQQARETVENYWQTVKSGKTSELAKFAEYDEETVYLPIKYLEDYTEGLALGLNGILETEQINNAVKKSMSSILAKIDYSIDDITKNGDYIIVRCTASMPDTDINLSSGTDTLLKIAGVSDQQELLTKFLESKNLTPDNALSAYAGSQSTMEKDFAQWLLDNYLTAFIDEMINNINQVQKSWDFVVEKDDGKWLIDEIREN